ncbi:hypothetical protein DFH08DRAFT_350258 [Mycena albidolilacea]|uniref:Uncharacterized protein n=1 Tax=Mycena albidolilacea TaxID=1033008 RepID=A0AAD6ZHR0_9AGAR|nr:hypothetical protein DFH08DRAFT_350258 [Mycena albidolilacea]
MYALVFFVLFGFVEEARSHYRLFGSAVGAAFWRVLVLVGVRRPATGIFTAKSMTSSSTLGSSSVSPKGIGHTKPAPPSFAEGIDISLPAYTHDGSFNTASFDADLKRMGLFVPSSRTMTSTTRTASSSQFVEGFEKDTGDVVSVSSVYSADGHVDARASIASSLVAASAPTRTLRR